MSFFYLMEYIDTVFLALKDREPCKVVMSSLQDPEKFILAVKELIDYGYLPNVHWDSSYSVMTIQEKFPFKSDKNAHLRPRPTTWYDHPETEDISH